MKKLAFIAFVLFLMSCSSGNRNDGEAEQYDSVVITKTVKERLSEKDKVELAKSVGIDTTLYIDFAKVLHSNARCKGIARYSKARPLRPVRLLELNEDCTSGVCSICIKSEAMRAIDEIVQGYKETEIETKI